jgi:hypothetical protein
MTMPFKRTLATLLLATVLPAYGAPVMNIDADNLVRGAGFVKETLHLTPNQQTLWQQVASKSAGLLRARQTRRDKLQAAFKAQLQDPALELRKLAGALAQEEAASAGENAELRELWLGLNDALDDRQRLLAGQFLLTQLERVDAPERAAGPSRGEPPPGGQRRQKPGADMKGGARF